MRIALIGAGHMASQHAAAWAELDEVEVTYVVARSMRRVGPLAERLDCCATTDLSDVLADGALDAVDITVPTKSHADVAIAALQAGKHVFCETPLAATAAEAERMLTAAHAARRHLQVALMMRFARPAIDLHAELKRGELGSLRAIDFRRFAPGAVGGHHGDPLEELMLFDLDTLTRCLGTPDRVRAEVEPGADGRIDRGRARAELRYGDVIARCEASYLQAEGEPFVATLGAKFEGGRLDARFWMPQNAWPTFELVRAVAGDESGSADSDLGPQPILEECRHFAGVVGGSADPALLDATQAIRSLRVLDALRASVTAGGWVWV